MASAWWLVPVALQSRYGGNFLSFLEQPAAIWSTTSVSESLRLLGYWIFYFATGYQAAAQPSVSVASPYLFNDAIVIATFAVPLLAVLGLAWNRGWRYGPFFGLIAVLGVLVMSTGFPEGKPLERVLANAYYNVGSLQFLRTTYKAAPDVAIGFACLVGAACATLYAATRQGSLRVLQMRVPSWALLVLVLVPVGYALPFFNGTAIDKRLDYKVPAYWRAALANAGRTTPPDKRIAIMPGQLFSWYRWGETVVSVAPEPDQAPGPDSPGHAVRGPALQPAADRGGRPRPAGPPRAGPAAAPARADGGRPAGRAHGRRQGPERRARPGDRRTRAQQRLPAAQRHGDLRRIAQLRAGGGAAGALP